MDVDSSTTIFRAHRVITMNPAQPYATAVAVRGDRVLGVGSVDELRAWSQDITIDEQFADKTLLPGFIEAHSHIMAGGMWAFPYVGFFDRRGPDGVLWSGCTTFGALIDRLIEADGRMEQDGLPADEVLVAWGLDPIYFPDERMVAHHLDRVSETRPIFVFHASAHLATVNTAMLRRSEITADTPTPGVSRGSDGDPDGELQEPPAMALADSGIKKLWSALGTTDAMWKYAAEARNAGHTLIADLGTSPLARPGVAEQWATVTAARNYPSRVLVALSSMAGGPSDPEELLAATAGLDQHLNDKLRFGVVKLVLDGSIQGFTARVSWPHYLHPPSGHPGNGLWLLAPDQLARILGVYHRAGLTIHVHCNGDEATEVFLDAIEQVLEDSPRPDHRHTVQHCQLTTQAQYKRMASLGMCANIFSNHIYYWGDQHRDITLGPERASKMNACATALRERVPLSIHSDAPVTPMGSLHVAWCAVNRLTAQGDVLGPEECISVHDALHAITLGAAYQLKLDHEMGSIEAGKLADFAVLDNDPLTIEPSELRDIGVWGTVLGGLPQPASGR